MKRLWKSYPVPLWIVALLLVACTVMASGWAQSQQRYIENRDFLLNRIAEQQRIIEDTQQINVGLMAANAIIIGTWQSEKQRKEEAEVEISRANGRLGPMQRRINDLESSVERMRNSWTSEVEAGR
ncbi:hypothetical protein [Vreelandella populi]|uniref:Uncharacterized protein n=1 Tax=Vreelandella populi TaxID=2498858 RepID=A0A433LG95_9GAMM|nr:hypothetical protein [Halomonas populi]RUR48811.1 hypothetical protein ELY37_02875 [Halomonas populi]